MQDKKQKHRLMVLKHHAVSGLGGSRVPRACSSPVLSQQPQLLLKRQAELKEIAAQTPSLCPECFRQFWVALTVDLSTGSRHCLAFCTPPPVLMGRFPLYADTAAELFFKLYQFINDLSPLLDTSLLENIAGRLPTFFF